MFFAKRLYKSMKVVLPVVMNRNGVKGLYQFIVIFSICLQGLGTADNMLIRIMVSRSEIDMLDIRECFRLRYEKSLYNMIQVHIHKHIRIQTFLNALITFMCIRFITIYCWK